MENIKHTKPINIINTTELNNVETDEFENLNPEQLIDFLYDTMYDKLFAYAKLVLKDDKLAEDVVQDTFLVGMSNAETVKKSQNPPGWIFNTLINVIRENKRKRAQLIKWILYVDPKTLADLPFGAKNIDEDVDFLYNDLLTNKEYILLKENVLENYSISELAEKYDISINACKERLYRARLKLRKLIEK